MKQLFKTSFFLVPSALLLIAQAYAQTAEKAAAKEQKTEALTELQEKPNAILFKIHDVTPVKNAEDVVTTCQYVVTFYNRTPFNVRQAKIDFGWTDTVSDLFLTEDKQEEEADGKKAKNAAAQKTAQKALGNVLSSVELPALGSLKQISVQGTVETEKCFILLDAMRFNVSECSFLGQETAGTSRRGRADALRSRSGCAELFSHVTPQNPEYYGTFKEISYSEQQTEEKAAEEAEKEAIEKFKKAVSENFEKTNEILSNIK